MKPTIHKKKNKNSALNKQQKKQQTLEEERKKQIEEDAKMALEVSRGLEQRRSEDELLQRLIEEEENLRK